MFNIFQILNKSVIYYKDERKNESGDNNYEMLCDVGDVGRILKHELGLNRWRWAATVFWAEGMP